MGIIFPMFFIQIQIQGFFRRAIKGSKKFACAYENKRQFEKRSRRHCSACRFNKCIEVGMKRECIMSDEQIVQKVSKNNFWSLKSFANTEYKCKIKMQNINVKYKCKKKQTYFFKSNFQRALIARNRLKRQALAKPVLSDQEWNTIKGMVLCGLN